MRWRPGSAVPPLAPVFEAGQDGDPRVGGLSAGAARPGVAEHVGISFSYAEDRALVAIAPGHRVGIDIEKCPRPGQPPRRDFEAIREAYFAGRRAPAANPDGAAPAPEVFLRQWSRHEAFLKAAGPGIVFPADDRDPAAEGFAVVDVDTGAGLCRRGRDRRAGGGNPCDRPAGCKRVTSARHGVALIARRRPAGRASGDSSAAAQPPARLLRPVPYCFA